MAHAGGRPPIYTEAILEKVRRYFEEFEPTFDTPVTTRKIGDDGKVVETEKMVEAPNKPPSIRKLAKYLGVSRDTIYDWRNKHKKFSDLFDTQWKEAMKECYIDNASLDLYNAGFSKFVMQNLCGWTDKTTNETTMKLDIPTKITIEIVRPKDAPANT